MARISTHPGADCGTSHAVACCSQVSQLTAERGLRPLAAPFQRLQRDGVGSISHGMVSVVPHTFNACLGPSRVDTIPQPAPCSDLGRHVGTWSWATARKLQSTAVKRCAEVCCWILWSAVRRVHANESEKSAPFNLTCHTQPAPSGMAGKTRRGPAPAPPGVFGGRGESIEREEAEAGAELGARHPRGHLSMSSRPGIPRRVALQQGPLPLRRPPAA